MKRYNFIFLVLLFFFINGNTLAQKTVVKKIVLDAGHGGKDPGALGTGRYSKTEKHISLDVTLKLGKYLKAEFPEIDIIYTRKKDTFPSLKDRTNIANESNADLFISIHCDSFKKSSAVGTSSHVMGLRYTEANLRVAQKENSVIYLEDNYEENYDGFDPYSPESIIAFSLSQTTYLDQSILIAQKIQEQFRDRVKRIDRGVKQTPLWVTRATNMPSVLVELGFISNPREEDFLNSEIGQSYMASAIFRAIKSYKDELELSVLDLVNDTSKLINKNDLSKLSSIKESKQKGVIFKVQIKTSLTRKIFDPVMDYDIDFFKENNLYKYTIGSVMNIEEAREIQKIAFSYGFKDAFIVAFLDNNKISISDAISFKKQTQ